MNPEFKMIQADINAMSERSEPTKNPDLSSVFWGMENLKADLGVKHRSEFNSDMEKFGKQLHEKLGLPTCNILDVNNGQLFTQEKVKGGGQGRVHVLDNHLNCIDDQVARAAGSGDMAGALRTVENSMRGLSKDDPDYYRAKEAFSRALNESTGRGPVTIEMVNGKLVALDGNYESLLPPERKHHAARPAEAPKSESPKPEPACKAPDAVPAPMPAESRDHRTPAQKEAAAKFWRDHEVDETLMNNPDGGKLVKVLPGDTIWNFASKEMEERQGHVMSETDRADMRNVLNLTKQAADENAVTIQPNGKALIRPNDWFHIPAGR